MSEYEKDGPRVEESVRANWEKHPVSLRMQRLEGLSRLFVLIRRYGLSHEPDRLQHLDHEAIRDYVNYTRSDELISPIRFPQTEATLADCEQLERGLQTMPKREREQLAANILRNLAVMIDADIKDATTYFAQGINTNDGEKFLGDVVQNARELLATFQEERTDLDAHLSEIELLRQRLLSAGMQYERSHPEAQGQTAREMVAWFALEDAALRERDQGNSDDEAVMTKYWEGMGRRMEECQGLIDLIEEYQRQQ